METETWIASVMEQVFLIFDHGTIHQYLLYCSVKQLEKPRSNQLLVFLCNNDASFLVLLGNCLPLRYFTIKCSADMPGRLS